MIVVVPDINVWVSKLYADKAAKSSTISQKVVRHLVSGLINGEPVQIAMSFKMLDTYREVLLRKEYPEALVEEEISALVDIMKFGPAGFDPHIVLGGAPDRALKDLEDRGVLATAYAAHAGMLITDNLKDFAGQDAEIYRTSRVQTPDDKTRELYCVVRARPDGKKLVIVHPADFISWTDRNLRISPAAIRQSFAVTPKP
jgi:predicted nucleic acid-binding protein